jgi:hypothetical protein
VIVPESVIKKFSGRHTSGKSLIAATLWAERYQHAPAFLCACRDNAVAQILHYQGFCGRMPAMLHNHALPELRRVDQYHEKRK